MLRRCKGRHSFYSGQAETNILHSTLSIDFIAVQRGDILTQCMHLETLKGLWSVWSDFAQAKHLVHTFYLFWCPRTQSYSLLHMAPLWPNWSRITKILQKSTNSSRRCKREGYSWSPHPKTTIGRRRQTQANPWSPLFYPENIFLGATTLEHG